jgi:hypothetical protein
MNHLNCAMLSKAVIGPPWKKTMNRLNDVTARIEGLEKKRLILLERLVGEGSLEKKDCRDAA